LIPAKELVSNQGRGTPGPEGPEKGNACARRSTSAGKFAFTTECGHVFI
jgi:hypothetical protein